MPRIVGLTGGIATGKSTVSGIWKAQGATIVDADAIARQVVRPGRPAYRLIRRHFGNAVLHADGTINRVALGKVIFSDATQRAALNRRIHPFIVASMVLQVAVAAVVRWRSVVVLDAPLLFESGTLVPLCSRVVVVTASRRTQIERMLWRDADKKLTEQDACQRIDSQMDVATKVRRADLVIDNSGSVDELRKQALHVLNQVQPNRRMEFVFRALVCAVAAGTVLCFVTLLCA